jgi:hypothetical protein
MPDCTADLIWLNAGGAGTVTGHRPPNYPELGSGAGTAFHRSTELPLGCLPTAPACARAHAEAVLHEWGLAPLAGDAVMIVNWSPMLTRRR